MEKLAFALITASRKLRRYFQVHAIVVMTDHSFKKSMNNEACVLYKPNTEGSRRMISTYGEIGFCINNSFQKAKALLPSACNCCYDGSFIQEVNEQLGSRRTIDPMGYQA